MWPEIGSHLRVTPCPTSVILWLVVWLTPGSVCPAGEHRSHREWWVGQGMHLLPQFSGHCWAHLPPGDKGSPRRGVWCPCQDQRQNEDLPAVVSDIQQQRVPSAPQGERWLWHHSPGNTHSRMGTSYSRRRILGPNVGLLFIMLHGRCQQAPNLRVLREIEVSGKHKKWKREKEWK